MKKVIFVITFFSFLAIFTNQSFGVPIELNYQGLLTDHNGDRVNGITNMTFRLYDEFNAIQWESGIVAVDVVNGVYNVILGENSQPTINPAIFAIDLWLGITLDSDDEMAPRQKLTSVSYSIWAETANSVAPDAVGSAEVLDGSLISKDLATDSVNVRQIASGAVRSDEVLDNSLTSDDLAPNSVGASEIDLGAVGADEIADGAVGADEIAINAVRSNKVLNNSLTSDDLAPNSVGASEIAAGALNNSLTADDLAPNSVGASEISIGAVGADEIADGAVTVSAIADNSIQRSKISGQEIALYRYPFACGSGLTTNSTCTSLPCNNLPLVFYDCSGNCTSQTTPFTCSNTKIGYLLSPTIP